MKNMKFQGVVEVDESHFGTKQKHHCGFLCGPAIWVVGLVESTNRVILYPVENRSGETMKMILLQHSEVGATKMTDGRPSYNFLNAAGYKHFNVIHTQKLKQVFGKKQEKL